MEKGVCNKGRDVIREVWRGGEGRSDMILFAYSPVAVAIYDYEALAEPGEEDNLEFEEGDLIEVCTVNITLDTSLLTQNISKHSSPTNYLLKEVMND